ncbi:MAG TPA: ABC transporter substrate-binding protein [Alphaproteobacteria bacterium]
MATSVHRRVRLFSLMLLVLCASAGRGFAADAAHTVALRLEWLPSGYQAPFYLAAAKGWYQKAGLSVTIEQGNGSNTTVQLVNAGQYDIGHAALSSVAVARNKGMSVRAVASFFRKGDMALMVSEDSGVKGPADLKGKKIIYSAASFEGPFLAPFLAKGGVTPDQLLLMNVDANARIPTYVNGDADGIFGSPVGTGVVIAEKRPTRFVLFADFDMNMPGFGLFTTEAKLQQKGEALRQFVSLSCGAWAYIVAGHQDEAVEALLKARAQDRLEPSLMKKQLEDSFAFLYTPATAGQPIGLQAESDWAAALKVMEIAKVIDPGSKPTDYFTNDYIDPALIKATAGG